MKHRHIKSVGAKEPREEIAGDGIIVKDKNFVVHSGLHMIGDQGFRKKTEITLW